MLKTATKKSVTTITVNTDASFSFQHKVGGFAFYIVCDLFRLMKSGKFRSKPTTALEAEIMCIGNAFAALLAQPNLPTCKWLVVNTDCQMAIEILRNNKTNNFPTAKKVYKLWRKLISQTGATKHKLRHVRAHTNKQDSRSWINRWCDTTARKHMREASKIEKEKE